MVVMKTTQSRFKSYCPDQILLLPPDLKQWLPEGDLAYFVMDVVAALDLSAIYTYYSRSRRGQPPYNPRMMTSLILYAYCMGVPSSRKIETATYNQIPFRVITADQHPDHDTIAHFRKTHLQALAGLFVNVLQLCQKAGLVKLGHIAPDGTKEPSDEPDPKAQRNFTDPQSRIMKDGASKSFEQAYNCQIASDEQSQVIVGTNVTQETNDKQQVKPVIEDVKQRTGQTPKKASLDAGYYRVTEGLRRPFSLLFTPHKIISTRYFA